MQWHIGCSGFYYRHWKEIFYPHKLPQRLWFNYYQQHFSTVEINGTFYKAPTAESLRKWYQDSPPEFTFAVKAPRLITHYRQFNNSHELIRNFYDAVHSGLEEKLGAVLFQLPPSFSYSEERLNRILQNLEHNYINVLELRHESWWQYPVYQRLAEQNITFCGLSHPTLPDTVVQNTGMLYYRFHGNMQLYTSKYTLDELKRFVDCVIQTGAKQVFVYFNNDIGGAAVENAKELMKIVAGY
ncbi:DUF72 domain-containing protein [Mucilaginibacter koreensis]